MTSNTTKKPAIGELISTAIHQRVQQQDKLVSARTCAHKRLLFGDKQGAIMVIGVFFAVFLLAILYYLVGIGDAVLHRERMQDAVDAASLSAAFLLLPRPRASSVPACLTVHSNSRSWSGPLTETT